jgi:hypothetical protein
MKGPKRDVAFSGEQKLFAQPWELQANAFVIGHKSCFVCQTYALGQGLPSGHSGLQGEPAWYPSCLQPV